MHDADIIQVLLACLLGVVGWIGIRIHGSMDQLTITLKHINDQVNALDKRLVKVETTCIYEHGKLIG